LVRRLRWETKKSAKFEENRSNCGVPLKRLIRIFKSFIRDMDRTRPWGVVPSGV
jgi:hypothetical protein